MAIEWNSNKTAAAIGIAGAIVYGIGQKACDDIKKGEAPSCNNVGIHQTVPMPHQKTTGDLVRALIERLDVQ